ncbi:MAG: hypothetical protein HY722_07530 [Planctomycetes bacterium]|nr:hypothetical protein [Planctomycetota bacterium]
MTTDLQAWTSDPEALAVVLGPEDLRGWFGLGHPLEVPEGGVALVEVEGETTCLGPGARHEGGFVRALLVLDREVGLGYRLAGLRSADGFEVEASCRTRLRPRTEEFDLLQALSFLGERRRLVRDDLHAHLLPAVQSCLEEVVRSRPMEALDQAGTAAALEEALAGALKEPCFRGGLRLVALEEVTLRSAAWEEARRAEAGARLRAEELVRGREVEALAQRLRKEGLLEQVAAREEVARERALQEAARFEQIRERFGNDDVKAMVHLLEDPREKSRLLEALIEQGMSGEQIEARRRGDFERDVAARLERFQSLLGSALGVDVAGGPRVRRLLAVVGRSVLAYDPRAGPSASVPRETYRFEDGPLGFLRSVRLARRADGALHLLAGAQGGVYVTELGPDGSAGPRKDYPFPRPEDSRGGANAAALFRDELYATHSDHGLVRWDLDGGPGALTLFEDLVPDGGPVRGAQVGPDGVLWFAAGDTVYAWDLVRRPPRPVAYRGAGGTITSLCAAGGQVLAGTGEGRICRWSAPGGEVPEAARDFGVRRANPITMLRAALIAGTPCVLIAAKDYGASARALEGPFQREFQAQEQVRWVDGASDRVFGVDRGGYRVAVWEAHRPQCPEQLWRTPDRVQDLAVILEGA